MNAHDIVYQARKKGLLVQKPECERCGAPSRHARHEDYDKPLCVVWLCYSCHMLRHGRLGRMPFKRFMEAK